MSYRLRTREKIYNNIFKNILVDNDELYKVSIPHLKKIRNKKEKKIYFVLYITTTKKLHVRIVKVE